MIRKINPYDALVGFVNTHNISPMEEEKLRDIIKDITELEWKKQLTKESKSNPLSRC